MSYRMAPMQGFGGLNMRDGADTVGIAEAVDLLNVEFSERGAVSQRAGYAKFSDEALANTPDSMTPFYKVDGTKRLVVGNGNKLTVLDTNGATVTSSTAPTASPHYFARFGGPTVEALYVANGTDQIRRYDTAGGFTAPAGLSGQTGRFLAVQSPDNRLVVARETGTTAGNNPSSVNFSNVGAPETFTSTDYVDLTPGDGEEITGICTWRELTFVFKPSRFWVFWGNTTVGAVTTFNNRMIDAGVGLVSPRALVAGEDAVYFLHRRGVYRTTGGPPQLVSDVLEPFFQGDPSFYYQSSTLNHEAITQAAIAIHDGRIHLAVPTGSSTTNNRMLVFDPQHNWWSMYDIAASCLTSFLVGTGPSELMFGYAAGTKLVGRHSSAFRGDQSTTGATNLVTNPRAVVDTAGWTNNALDTFERVTSLPASIEGATTALHAVEATQDTASFYDSVAVTSGQTYRFSAYVYLASLTATNVRLRVYNSAVVSQAVSTGLTAIGAWTRLDVSFTANETATWTFRVEQNGAGASNYYATKIRLEQSATLNPYFDGDSVTPNIVTNPSFEVNTAGWHQMVAGSFSRTADGSAPSGSFVLEQVCPGTTAEEGCHSDAFEGATPSATMTASVYVKLISGSGALKLQIGEYTSAGVQIGVTTQAFTATGSYARVEVSRAFGTTGTRALVWVYTAGATASTFRVDAVQVEQAAAAATYQDYGSTAYWTGTAHASTSAQLSNAAIVSRWRSGWQDFGTPQEKTVRESQLWGAGEVTFELNANFDTDISVGEAVSLAQGTATKEALIRKALPGVVFSTELSNSTLNHTFTVNRLSHHLREVREPDVAMTS